MNKFFTYSKTKIFIDSFTKTIYEFSLKKKILLVTTKGSRKRGIVNEILKIFCEGDILILDAVEPNPELDLLNSWIAKFKNESIKSIIAIGGGSSIDTAKILSIGLSNDNSNYINDFLFKKQFIKTDSTIPVIAIPTTSGSGAEVTPFATVWDEKVNKKYSFSSELIRPKYAILDYSLTVNLPLDISIYSGLDAISHCFESIWNLNASSRSIEIASTALNSLINNLPKLIVEPCEHNSRKLMQINSCLAGLAISSTKTALAHSISYPLTTNYNIPHGLACSFTLPEILIFNSKKDDGRLLRLSNYLGFKDIDYLYKELKNLFQIIDLNKRLKKKLPVDMKEVYRISDQMFNPDRVSNNLRMVTLEDIDYILYKSLSN